MGTNNRALILAVVLMISSQGCTGFGETRPKTIEAEKVTGQGMIFGSIARPGSGRGFHRYTLYFKALDSDTAVPVSVNAYVPGYSLFTTYTDPDEIAEDLERWLFVKVLPPGEYALVKFEAFFNQGGMATHTWSPKRDMRCSFTVKPGEKVYLGEHSFIHKQAETLLGIDVPSSPTYAIADKEESDLGLAENVFPDIDWAGRTTAEFVGLDVWMEKCSPEELGASTTR